MLGRCTTGPCAAKAFCAPLAPHHSDRDEKRGGECASFHSPPLPVWPMSALDRRHLALPKALRHFIRQSAGPCEPREREVETRLLQLLVTEPPIQPFAGDVAHLVVQHGPFGASSLEAEGDEIDRHLGDPLLWHSVPPRCDRAHHPHPLTKRQGFSSTFLSTAFSTRSDHVSHRPSTVMSISSSCDPRNDDARADARSRDRALCRRTSHARRRARR